ncbi:MAG: alanine racemase, partial [Candidatus Promineifilaceae bacterium]
MSRNKSFVEDKPLEMSTVRPTRVTIDLEQLAQNYQAIKQKVGNRKVMAVLKANAYGHGLVEI